MTETTSEPDVSTQPRGRGRPKAESIALTKAAGARFDALAAESIEAVFQAVLTAATQNGDMVAARLLVDRVIPSRRGAPVSFHIRPLKTPEDCALAYADLLDDVGAGRLTPEEAQTIAAIVAKRRAVPINRAGGRDRSSEGAARRHCRASTSADVDPPPLRNLLTRFPPHAQGRLGLGRLRRASRRHARSVQACGSEPPKRDSSSSWSISRPLEALTSPCISRPYRL